MIYLCIEYHVHTKYTCMYICFSLFFNSTLLTSWLQINRDRLHFVSTGELGIMSQVTQGINLKCPALCVPADKQVQRKVS